MQANEFRKRLLTLWVTTIVAQIFLLPFILRPIVLAQPNVSFGRDLEQTYYSGYTINPPADDSWYNFDGTGPFNFTGLRPDNSIPIGYGEFIYSIESRLNSPHVLDSSRASIIVNMMLGYDAQHWEALQPNPNLRWQVGVNNARARIQDWKDLVRLFDITGRVNFNGGFTDPDGARDWLGPRTNFVGFPDSVSTFVPIPYNNDPSVVFYDASGAPLFTILKKCANMVGDLYDLTINSSCVALGMPGVVPNNRKFTLSPGVRVNVPGYPVTPSTDPTLDITIRRVSTGQVVMSSPGAPYTYSSATDTVLGSVEFLPTQTGSYTVEWKVTYPLAGYLLNKTCNSSFDVGEMPYFSVYGGDIVAGISMGGMQSGSHIYGSNNNNNTAYPGATNYYGAGSGGAAIATGSINSFSTLYGSNTPSRLAFANTGSLSSPKYGGGYTSLAGRPDYYGEANGMPGKQNLTAPGNIIDISTLGNGIYTFDAAVNGNLVVRASSPLPAGRDITILVSGGSAFIENNILYGNYQVNSIPSFKLMVNGGDIVVNGKPVNEIHGTFLAQDSSGTKGRFVTCGTSANNPILYTGLGVASNYNHCNFPLKVYGSAVADSIILSRVWGSFVNTQSGANNAAEEFIQTPEQWIKKPDSLTLPDSFDSYVNLPPVL